MRYIFFSKKLKILPFVIISNYLKKIDQKGGKGFKLEDEGIEHLSGPNPPRMHLQPNTPSTKPKLLEGYDYVVPSL